MFGSVVPQHCKWAELLQCVGLEMVVQVVEWECIFEMDVVGVAVVVEVNGKDNMEFGMEYIEKVLRILWMASISSLPTLFPILVLGLR